MSEQEHIYTQSTPSNKGLKKFTIALAAVSFVIAVLVATYYKPLSSTPDPNSAASFSFEQFQTEAEFFNYLQNSGLSTLSQQGNIYLDKSIGDAIRTIVSKDALFTHNADQIIRVNIPDGSRLSETVSNQDLQGMLIAGDTLAIQTPNSLIGLFSVDLSKKWNIDFADGILKYVFSDQNFIYAITSSQISQAVACPLPFATQGEIVITTPCDFSYHPNRAADVNTLYTIVAIDPNNGGIIKRISFVGDSGGTSFAVNKNSLFFISTLPVGDPENAYNIIVSKAKDLLPTEIILRAQELSTYDISPHARLFELNKDIYKYQNSLPHKQRTDFTTKLNSLLVEHGAGLSQTAIAAVKLSTFEISNAALSTGTVNQVQINDQALAVASPSQITVFNNSLDELDSKKINNSQEDLVWLLYTKTITANNEGRLLGAKAAQTLESTGYIAAIKYSDEGDKLVLEVSSMDHQAAEVAIDLDDASVSLQTEGDFVMATTSRASYLYLFSSNTLEMKAFYTSARKAGFVPIDGSGIGVSTTDSVTLFDDRGGVVKTISLAP